MKKTIYKIAIATATILLASGCVSKNTVPMKPAVVQDIKEKSFTYVKREYPIKPMVMTPGMAMTMGLGGAIGGALGGAFMASEAYSEDKVYASTPSHYINTKLSEVLKKKHNMNLVEVNSISDNSSIDDLVEEYAGVDYLVDNRDMMWQVIYYPFHFFSYKVRYESKFRFIDVKNRVVVAEGYCEYDPDYSDNSPSYDDLFDNNAEGLKNITRQALDGCVDKYLKEVI